MAHVEPNFQTKKGLKEAVQRGDTVSIFQPGGVFPMLPGPLPFGGVGLLYGYPSGSSLG